MAWSLGSLFVELKANTAQFLDGMTKASAYATKTGRDIERGLGKAGSLLTPLGSVGQKLASILDGVGSAADQAFSSVGRMGGFLGVMTAGVGGVTALGGAMFALADHASAVGAKIHEASVKTGIGAAQMSGLMAIAKETGSDFETLSLSLSRAGVNLEKGIINPGSQSGKVLSQVMGGAKNLSDLGLKPMGDRIQIVLSRIFAMNDTGQRNVALSALMGRGWMNSLAALKLLAEGGYGPAIEQAKKFGVFFDDKAAADAKQFQAALAIVKEEVGSFGMTIGKTVMPYLAEWLKCLPGMEARLTSWGLAVMAVGQAITGQFSAAKETWKEHVAAAKEADQVQTDFEVNLSNVARAEGKTTEETVKLTDAVRGHRDVLLDIIQREKDEISALDINGNKQRELRLEYDRTVQEIKKAVEAGGDYAEGLKAQALALDLYLGKLARVSAIIPKTPTRAGAPVEPNIGFGEMTGISSDVFNPPQFQEKTLSQIAQFATQTDSTRGAMRALRMETELSDDSFKRLAAAFPGLTEAEVAATAAGRKMIDQLTRLDKLGSLGSQFTELKNTLILEGDELSTHLVQTLGGAINGIEDQLARLAVTGKANFKSLYQGIGEQITKAGLQKGVGVLLGGLHLPGVGAKRDGGTAQAALYVTPVNDSGRTLGGMLGAPGSGTAGAPAASSILGNLSSSLSKLFGAFGSIGKGITGALGGLFGGFLAQGGDVTPGKAYVVGEKHPEWFMPGRAGQIVPSLSVQQLRPIAYSPTFHINTPNADSFRRSQAQVLEDGYRTMAMMHARNS